MVDQHKTDIEYTSCVVCVWQSHHWKSNVIDALATLDAPNSSKALESTPLPAVMAHERSVEVFYPLEHCLWYSIWIFSHLKLCLAAAIHNFKRCVFAKIQVPTCISVSRYPGAIIKTQNVYCSRLQCSGGWWSVMYYFICRHRMFSCRSSMFHDRTRNSKHPDNGANTFNIRATLGKHWIKGYRLLETTRGYVK